MHTHKKNQIHKYNVCRKYTLECLLQSWAVRPTFRLNFKTSLVSFIATVVFGRVDNVTFAGKR
jgi:hypothetical protein